MEITTYCKNCLDTLNKVLGKQSWVIKLTKDMQFSQVEIEV